MGTQITPEIPSLSGNVEERFSQGAKLIASL
jgi:hypothetical protein